MALSQFINVRSCVPRRTAEDDRAEGNLTYNLATSPDAGNQHITGTRMIGRSTSPGIGITGALNDKWVLIEFEFCDISLYIRLLRGRVIVVSGKNLSLCKDLQPPG